MLSSGQICAEKLPNFPCPVTVCAFEHPDLTIGVSSARGLQTLRIPSMPAYDDPLSTVEQQHATTRKRYCSLLHEQYWNAAGRGETRQSRRPTVNASLGCREHAGRSSNSMADLSWALCIFDADVDGPSGEHPKQTPFQARVSQEQSSLLLL